MCIILMRLSHELKIMMFETFPLNTPRSLFSNIFYYKCFKSDLFKSRNEIFDFVPSCFIPYTAYYFNYLYVLRFG